MAFRGRPLLGLLRQAMSRDTSGLGAFVSFETSSALQQCSVGLRTAQRRYYQYRNAVSPASAPASAQDMLLHDLNARNDPERVIELFERNQVAPTQANLCEYVKALVKMDRLDGTALSATLARGAQSMANSSQSYGNPSRAEDVQRHSAFDDNSLLGRSKVPEGDLGSVKNPIYVTKMEPSFWQQLWGTIRTLGIAFVIIAGISAAMDERGMSPRGLLNNPDLKPQLVSTTKFEDVKGVDEAKDELEEVVHYLQDPAKFTHLGGKLPKGVLLVGPPGTGKTMLARAIAGEAGVPFFYTSGSEFEEMFVGVGARRVRDLFKAAKAAAPCIIFIDEIDAIGGSRNPKDQMYMKMTLNQMLVELDGFKPSEGVIVVAATNFPESLDKALIRPGRFDRHIVVPNPDVKGRVQILEVNFKKVKKAPEVDLEVIARGTPGFSGADLANLVNVAALKAARDNLDAVDQACLEYAKDRIMMGAERKSAVISEENRKLTAYHEGGHALVALYTDGSLPVHKATIVPRGMALGMVMQLPDKDDSSVSKRQLLAKLDVAMGGRVAEEIIFGRENITTGASSDLRQATRLAQAMVTKYGFSDKVGNMSIEYDESSSLSTDMRAIVESEVRKLVNDSYERARALLQRHEKELHLLAKRLLESETLTGQEINELLGRKAT